MPSTGSSRCNYRLQTTHLKKKKCPVFILLFCNSLDSSPLVKLVSSGVMCVLVCACVTHVDVSEGVCVADKVILLLLAPGSVTCKEDRGLEVSQRLSLA